MHILLTDILRCPRCGPEFGLVLLADRVEDRRVEAGRLGCANCREMYPVAAGEVDLRVPGAAALPEGGAAGPDEAVRLAALLGLSEAWGSVLLAGAGADLADALAALVPGVEVVHAVGRPGSGEGKGEGRLSRLVGGAPLPFAPGSLRGVALGREAAGLLEEGVRLLAPGGRLVVEGAPAGAAEELAAAGLRVLLDQEGWLVAERAGGGATRKSKES
jgi:uncharacterized protein YbaR (Trm112 family)